MQPCCSTVVYKSERRADPLKDAHGPPGVRGPQFENHCGRGRTRNQVVYRLFLDKITLTKSINFVALYFSLCIYSHVQEDLNFYVCNFQ